MSQPIVLGKGCKNARIGIKSYVLLVLCLYLKILVQNKHFVNLKLGVNVRGHGRASRS